MGRSAGSLVLGTRGSGLAMWQARHVAARIAAAHPGVSIDLQVVRTEGDVDPSLTFGGWSVGVFVRRLEEALRDGTIDLAVHSLKDVPTEIPEDLTLAAVLERHDARDALVTPTGVGLDDLPPRTTIGTGSLRRRAQLLRRRPDLRTRPVRGNVDSRVRKLLAGEYGALALAVAGIERLGLDRAPWTPLAVDVCLPAVGQGAIGVETRAGDTRTIELLRAIDHEPTHVAVRAERSFLDRLGGGCLAPASAYAVLEDGRVWVRAFAGDADGTELVSDEERGSPEDATTVGRRLAERMLAAGAGPLLARSRNASGTTGPDGD